MKDNRPLTLEISKNLSVSDLIRLKNEGHFVFRSGHLGNHYLSNLLLYSCGIPCHLFDRNITSKDVNYWPHLMFVDGESSSLSVRPSDRLVHFQKMGEEANVLDLPSDHGDLARFHFDSMRSLFGTLVSSDSHFLSENEKTVETVTKLLASLWPELFERVFESDGLMYRKCTSDKDIITSDFLATNEFFRSKLDGENPSSLRLGRLPRIDANLMIHLVSSCLRFGKNQVYEISGPDMVRYADKEEFKDFLNKIYVFLRKSIPDLPESVVIHIVPSFDFRFGGLASEKQEVDSVVGMLGEYSSLLAEKREIKRRNPNDGACLKDELSSVSGRLAGLASEIHGSKVGKRIGFDLSKHPFFSQYDLIYSGEEMYVPQGIMDSSMSKLQVLMEMFTVSKQHLNTARYK